MAHIRVVAIAFTCAILGRCPLVLIHRALDARAVNAVIVVARVAYPFAAAAFFASSGRCPHGVGGRHAAGNTVAVQVVVVSDVTVPVTAAVGR